MHTVENTSEIRELTQDELVSVTGGLIFIERLVSYWNYIRTAEVGDFSSAPGAAPLEAAPPTTMASDGLKASVLISEAASVGRPRRSDLALR
jgi:hypothetical protein